MAESVDYKIDNKDLIAAIRNYECLYRRKHPDYKNAKVKEAAWESVAQMVSNTSYNCKQRWRSLTDRNRKEIAHSGSGRKPWKLKDEMAFFNEALQADSTFLTFNFSHVSNSEHESTVEIAPSPKKRREEDPLAKKKSRRANEDDESFFDLLRVKLARLSAEEKDEIQIDILSLVVNKIKNRRYNEN
ncbi:uncharacterized protein [Eurosta solidaginis]|uniref:uncharacterized protein isoform X1 n=1 Tax=Eurosta solidaginis TaxID=178769 RepID=UPI00353076A6